MAIQYMSVIYGILYALFEAFPIIWGQGYGFNGGEVGLVFIGVGAGTTLGASASPVIASSGTMFDHVLPHQSSTSSFRGIMAPSPPSGMVSRLRRSGYTVA